MNVLKACLFVLLAGGLVIAMPLLSMVLSIGWSIFLTAVGLYVLYEMVRMDLSE